MNHSNAARILIVDDTAAIHADFAKILSTRDDTTELDKLERLAFGDAAAMPGDSSVTYELESAFQGVQAIECVQAALRRGEHYALAFVDMRMPPGIDGLQTIEGLWQIDPDMQIVICSAYSEYDWGEVLRRLDRPSQLLVVKKPFEAIEVLQCANAMTSKWRSERELRDHLFALEQIVRQRTASLEEANAQLREQMRLREAVEVELGLAQKLESVGRLASGIAHEINTPIQYISDSVHFLRSAFTDMIATRQNGAAAGDAGQDADMEFLIDEVPRAVDRTLHGVERVATIVRAMKDFAHPDGTDKASADLNRAIETTLLIARNEYKYVATIHLDCADIPEVVCNVGELSQVFLNLIVNSAHALADAGRDAESGRIDISTRHDGDHVEICFSDNGCGIPGEVINKIYDPFFTTKEIGRGSGQGLAIARSIVVDKHGGKIVGESEVGKGARFTLRLPIGADGAAAA
jgi:signal transduction histidine kinase